MTTITMSCYSVFIGFKTRKKKKETFQRFVWAENKQEAYQLVLQVARDEKHWGKVTYKSVSKPDLD